MNSHLERTRNPDFILWTMGVNQAVLRSLLRVFRAVPLPPALTLPLPLNPTPPPASIHGDSARGFPEHLARGFDVMRTMATATGWRAPVSTATVSTRPRLSYQSSPSCQLTQLCVGYHLHNCKPWNSVHHYVIFTIHVLYCSACCEMWILSSKTSKRQLLITSRVLNYWPGRKSKCVSIYLFFCFDFTPVFQVIISPHLMIWKGCRFRA